MRTFGMMNRMGCYDDIAADVCAVGSKYGGDVHPIYGRASLTAVCPTRT